MYREGGGEMTNSFFKDKLPLFILCGVVISVITLIVNTIGAFTFGNVFIIALIPIIAPFIILVPAIYLEDAVQKSDIFINCLPVKRSYKPIAYITGHILTFVMAFMPIALLSPLFKYIIIQRNGSLDPLWGFGFTPIYYGISILGLGLSCIIYYPVIFKAKKADVVNGGPMTGTLIMGICIGLYFLLYRLENPLNYVVAIALALIGLFFIWLSYKLSIKIYANKDF